MATAPPNTYVANATVVRVVDGDTIDVTVDGTEERVRLIGIDTPETVKPNTPVECFGPEASAHTKELLPAGTPVYLERDARSPATTTAGCSPTCSAPTACSSTAT